MSPRKPKMVARLWWSPQNTLWLACWPVASLEPIWHGDKRNRQPDGWAWKMGISWAEGREKTHEEAMRSAEIVVMGQLASVGIHAAGLRRPDGTTHTLEMPWD